MSQRLWPESHTSETFDRVAFQQFDRSERVNNRVRLYLFSQLAVGFSDHIRAQQTTKSLAHFQSSPAQVSHETLSEAIHLVGNEYHELTDYAITQLMDTHQFHTALCEKSVPKVYRQVKDHFVLESSAFLSSDNQKVEEIYQSLGKFKLTNMIISELVIPKAITAQARSVIRNTGIKYPELVVAVKKAQEVFEDKNNVCTKWAVSARPQNEAEIIDFLQKSVFSSATPVDDVVVVADAVSAESNYFFAAKGVVKTIGEYTLTVKHVNYHANEKNRSQANSHLNLNKSSVESLPGDSGRYVQFYLTIENAQHEKRDLCVHFLKMEKDGSIYFDRSHDRAQFFDKLANPSLQRKVLVQGKAGEQLITMILFANQWKHFSLESTPKQIAEKYLNFLYALRQYRPALHLTQAQFAAAVGISSCLLIPLAPKLQRSLVSSISSPNERKPLSPLAPSLTILSPVPKPDQPATRGGQSASPVLFKGAVAISSPLVAYTSVFNPGASPK